MTVRNELTRSRTRRSDAQPVYHVVEARFEQLEQVLTRDTAHTGSLFKSLVELFFEYTVGIFRLLFLAELSTVFRYFLAFTVDAVLSRRIVLLLQSLVDPIDRLTELTCNLGFWSYISCHCFLIFVFKHTALPGTLCRPVGATYLIADSADGCSVPPAAYTLRRLGARQPLCGSGVTSMISITSMPEPCIVRIADSRPAPGPLT